MQIRCPHCRHPVEVVDSKLLDEVTCPSCGSNISLVSKESTVAHTPATTTAAYTATSPRRLGHFELLEQVGVGGFGAVWKARDTVLDRIVALKVPRRGQLEAAETEFFLRDARAAAQLRHPNIVSVHEVGRDGGTVFIASDFIDGANLREWLSARPLTIREAAELVAQVAEAVQHAHERGVVHRDLKPGNILMDQEGRPTAVNKLAAVVSLVEMAGSPGLAWAWLQEQAHGWFRSRSVEPVAAGGGGVDAVGACGG